MVFLMNSFSLCVFSLHSSLEMAHLDLSGRLDFGMADARTRMKSGEVYDVFRGVLFRDSIAEDRFFVRESYSVYYERIVNLFRSGEYLAASISGSGGIGISVFYMYFFLRLREEYRTRTVVTISFARNHEMIGCVVFRGGSNIGEPRLVYPNIRGALYLVDGSPPYLKHDAFMVLFGHPTERWSYREMGHVTLYMPPWTIQELLKANRLLKLDLADETVIHRFSYFGGSVRFCFARNTEWVGNAITAIEETIKDIKTIEALFHMVVKTAEFELVSPELFHIQPFESQTTGGPVHSRVVYASKAIEKMIDKQLRCLDENWEAKFVKALKYAGRAALLLRQLFENRCHSWFIQSGPSSWNVVSLEDGHHEVMEMNEYRKMKCSVSHLIEGYWFAREDTTLWLLKMTIDEKVCIKLSHIRSVLNKLYVGLKSGTISCKLVFVVPQGLENLQKQPLDTVDQDEKIDYEYGGYDFDILRIIREKIHQYRLVTSFDYKRH